MDYPRLAPSEKRHLKLRALAKEAARNASSSWGVSFGQGETGYYYELTSQERYLLEKAIGDASESNPDPLLKAAARAALLGALMPVPAYADLFSVGGRQLLNLLGYGVSVSVDAGLGGAVAKTDIIFNAFATQPRSTTRMAITNMTGTSPSGPDGGFSATGTGEVVVDLYMENDEPFNYQWAWTTPTIVGLRFSPDDPEEGTLVAFATLSRTGYGSAFGDGPTPIENATISVSISFGVSCNSLVFYRLAAQVRVADDDGNETLEYVPFGPDIRCDGASYGFEGGSPSIIDVTEEGPQEEAPPGEAECDAQCIREIIDRICADPSYGVNCDDPCDPYEPPSGGPTEEPPPFSGGAPYEDPGEIGNPPGYNPPPYDPPPGGGFIDPGGVTCVEYEKGNLPPGFIDPSRPGGIGAKYQKGQEMCVRDETDQRICGKITSVRLREDLSAKICIEPVVPGDKRTPEKKCYEGEIQDIISQVLSEMGFDGEIIFDSEPECVKFFSKPVCFPEKTPFKTILKYFLNMCGWCYFPQFDSTVIVGYCGPTDVHWYFHEDEGEALGTEVAEGLQLPLMGIDLEYDNREAFAFVEVFKADYRRPDGTFRRGFSVTYPVPSPFAIDPEQVYFHEVPQGTSLAEGTSLAATLARKLSFKNTPLIAWKVPINHDLNYRDQIHIRRPSVPFSQRYMITKLAKEYDREQGYYSLGLARYLGA